MTDCAIFEVASLSAVQQHKKKEDTAGWFAEG